MGLEHLMVSRYLDMQGEYLHEDIVSAIVDELEENVIHSAHHL